MKFLILCVLVASWKIGHGQKSSILDRILAQGYDWRERPVVRTANGTATIVTVNIYFRQIQPADDGLKIELTFRQSWSDPRLNYPANSANSIVLSPLEKSSRRIWTPDTFFQNGHDVKMHSEPNLNELTRVLPSGEVLLSQRLSMVVACPMSLEYFPSDKQICNLDLASYGYTSDDIVYTWKQDSPLQFRDGLYRSIAQFELVNSTTGSCTSKTNTGTYSCLRASLHLQRVATTGVKAKVYLIPLLLVVLSWLPFIINTQLIVVRVLIGLICLSTLIIHWSLISNDLPKVGYSTGADEFLSKCLGFIAATFVQLIFYVWVVRSTTSHKKRKLAKQRAAKTNEHEDASALIQKESTWKSERKLDTDLLVDLISLAIFVLAFLVFFVHYFTKY